MYFPPSRAGDREMAPDGHPRPSQPQHARKSTTGLSVLQGNRQLHVPEASYPAALQPQWSFCGLPKGGRAPTGWSPGAAGNEPMEESAGAMKFSVSPSRLWLCLRPTIGLDGSHRARGCPPPLAAGPPPEADFFFSLHGMPVPCWGLASSGRRAWKDGGTFAGNRGGSLGFPHQGSFVSSIIPPAIPLFHHPPCLVWALFTADPFPWPAGRYGCTWLFLQSGPSHSRTERRRCLVRIHLMGKSPISVLRFLSIGKEPDGRTRPRPFPGSWRYGAWKYVAGLPDWATSRESAICTIVVVTGIETYMENQRAGDSQTNACLLAPDHSFAAY